MKSKWNSPTTIFSLHQILHYITETDTYKTTLQAKHQVLTILLTRSENKFPEADTTNKFSLYHVDMPVNQQHDS